MRPERTLLRGLCKIFLHRSCALRQVISAFTIAIGVRRWCLVSLFNTGGAMAYKKAAKVGGRELLGPTKWLRDVFISV